MIRRSQSTADEVTEVICVALDKYLVRKKPELMVSEILTALERIRFALTEGVLEHYQRTKH